MNDAIGELAALLKRLPGVGKRTALRHTLFLLRSSDEYVRQLGQAIAALPDKVRPCSVCRNLGESDPCPICDDPRRDGAVICVVTGVADLWAIEETGSFRGRYHVLHGLLAPLDGIGPEELRVDLLRERVEREEIDEVIVATRPSLEGEATALLVRQMLGDLKVRTTRIAAGIPLGGEVEYADRFTLERALQDRREYS